MNLPLPDVPEVRVVGLPQLTQGFDLVDRLDLPMHLKVHGPLAPVTGELLARLSEEIALRGRGGAGFPFGQKLRSVARSAIRRGVRPVVVVNGSEGEPACRKDSVLLNRTPHLILDGALLAAEALGARTLVTVVTRNSTEVSVRAALAERGLTDRRGQGLRARVVRTPERMVSGEASAVIRAINGGPALPPGRRARAADTGVGGAPTLLSNAETFAQLAVAARLGAGRFRRSGTDSEPGTVLLTVSGAVARPMVVEVPTGVPLRYVLRLAGAPPLPQGVLTGGYHGNWIDGPAVDAAVVERASLAAVGGSLGAGAILPVGPETCPLGEALRVANWLAAETAGQCGPCRLGLPAAAGGLADVIGGGGPAALEALREVALAVRGRGACKHPDGSARFVTSALSAFTDDLAAHVLRGGCGRETTGVLPLPLPGRRGTEESVPSGEKVLVDWTLCQGHGLCADVVPELIRIGPDGYPAVADAVVPVHLRGRAQRAVRRCPALALRIEQTQLPAPDTGRSALPYRSGGRAPAGGRG
ncbi:MULTISPECIES: NADH-quinone oxidoreductase subunit NuoF family protein [Streptomyces]|uniref:Oxidoreductase n=1 Tax=Streptomyces tsukubensis (strain DSM 42081 / NBRC 108919 / NRRL 18488 / 9993) TaxID=1114943 RepID=I2MY38_STRT9|nr:NADH-quinone oxidoreductase subunit NuoF family protein [Streptomyces tsukubensis]MYS67202.1 oxidoreductase [Streptomyces sp. SID5473]AZK94024.1 oxidoreductase [Streptomyces tsukubensis]EIF89685.1 Respiratory-chain NADH dehydrogenase domain 51 kDa subunit [Streptomyces tsukubensis NRRL18488]QKM69862.1 oxidoreductase [Streptomyces tsukubensis NRRL18488]TAI46164.1 oxidoreductase [Streptomyces tsukubensis]